MLEDMQASSCKPNARTYAALIDACSRAENTEMALRVYQVWGFALRTDCSACNRSDLPQTAQHITLTVEVKKMICFICQPQRRTRLCVSEDYSVQLLTAIPCKLRQASRPRCALLN